MSKKMIIIMISINNLKNINLSYVIILKKVLHLFLGLLSFTRLFYRDDK